MSTEYKNHNIKIFSLNRISFHELWNDAQEYIRNTYKAINQAFTPASPFGLILLVVLHMGRMVLYYIEDSITGLNIRTAYRPDLIRGLALLTGHVACRPIASRAAIKITYFNDTGSQNLIGGTCYIPNKIKVTSKINGSNYTILFGADHAKITMNPGNYVNATIIAGTIKIQLATGTGYPLLSFNFVERNYSLPDEYYLNVYVNGEAWDVVESLVDLGFQLKGCVVRTGITSGVDIFFGNGTMGAIPEEGSIIMVEYLVSDGAATNIDMEYENTDNFWTFNDTGYLEDGTPVDLNGSFDIKLQTDLIFGTSAEDIALTQLIAPHTSRSYVLATEINYRYFFKRMNMFKEIEVTQGTSNRTGLTILNNAYLEAKRQYDQLKTLYEEALAAYNNNTEDDAVKRAKAFLDTAYQTLQYTETRLSNSIYVDNTVHIMLIPDIRKRISSTLTYFTCPIELFILTLNEKNGLLEMLNVSGQKIITVENTIEDPKCVKFAINVYAKIFQNYTYNDVYTSGLNALSKFLLNLEKRETIPASDIIALFENEVQGIDSVRVQFVPDKENWRHYQSDAYLEEDDDSDTINGTSKKFYGIDSNYGDVILYRYGLDAAGNSIKICDLMPLFRGGFTGTDGKSYSDDQTSDEDTNCAFNLYIQENNIVNKTLSLDHTVI